MSAFQCSTCHMSLLATAVVRGATLGDTISWSDVTRVFRRLARENVRSLKHRYPGMSDWVAQREPCEQCARFVTCTPMDLVSLARGYAYQACEHPGWLRSQARRDIERMVYDCAREWPGMTSGPWAIPNCS